MTTPNPAYVPEDFEAAVRAEVERRLSQMFWVATAPRKHGGRRVLGPFPSSDEAIDARRLMEQHAGTLTYWVVTGDDIPEVQP